MIGILKKYLDKIGVKDFTELTGEERATYDKWHEVLSKEITVETIREFIELQVVDLRKNLKSYVMDGKERQALLATARLENYEALLDIIDEPNRSKESLEQHIKSLLVED